MASQSEDAKGGGATQDAISQIEELAHDIHQGGAAILMHLNNLRIALERGELDEAYRLIGEMEKGSQERFVDYPRSIMRIIKDLNNPD